MPTPTTFSTQESLISNFIQGAAGCNFKVGDGMG